MKLTPKASIILQCFILIMGCIEGCSRKNHVNRTDVEFSEEQVSQELIQEALDSTTYEVNSFSSVNVVPDKQYTLYRMNQGKVVRKENITLSVDASIDRETIYRALVKNVVDLVGASIVLNEIKIQNDVIIVDLSSRSDIFNRTNFTCKEDRKYVYKSYEEWVFGVLDSIQMTLKQASMSQEIIYLKDGKALEFRDLKVNQPFLVNEPYQGYKYYLEEKEFQKESGLTDLCQLGMAYNDVILALNEAEVRVVQSDLFSALGDFEQYESYETFEEYLPHAWTRTILSNADYEFIFDLEDTSLVGIYVTSDQYTSARGLSVSQSLDQLIKLYGKANRRFKSNGYDLYEYTCSDCYFQAYIDPTEDRIVKIGISKISEVTVREGAEKVRELKKKSYRLREK